MSAVEKWLAAFERIEAASLCSGPARAVVSFLGRYAAGVASLVECRRSEMGELVIVNFQTGAPQCPIYPIRVEERVGILFLDDRRSPYAVMLRDDFPDTEHQQVVPENHPAVICIDDRVWAEARLTWTPSELVQRILTWFHRAARGELHDARQPLDPNLLVSGLSFIVGRSALEDGAAALIAEHDPLSKNILRVKRRADLSKVNKNMEPITLAVYRVEPAAMKRLRTAPGNLADLASILRDRGVDLVGDLSERLAGALNRADAAWQLNSRFAVLVELPVISPGGDLVGGSDTRAFITPSAAGEIAVALGLALHSKRAEGSTVGYVKRFAAAAPDISNLGSIPVQCAEVHLEFDRQLAARLAGRETPDSRRVVLIGAGAIGSHVADCLAREGRFSWTVIDDDRLLPHNIARHVAVHDHVPEYKARLISEQINHILPQDSARAIVANLFAGEPNGEDIDAALKSADLIIDASASLVAARALSDCDTGARRLSVFFNPSGDAAVLLAEPADRSITLRDLEAQYLGLLVRTAHLADHLGRAPETIAYTGACRAITNRIPQWRAAVLSGLAAGGIGRAVDVERPAISVWTMADNLSVLADCPEIADVLRYEAIGWKISLDLGLLSRIREMRSARLPSETGGILFGLVDIPARFIHIVHAAPAPPDSREEGAGFIRGVQGVEETIERVRRVTAGQLRYIGEWHSHPPRASAMPSAEDGRQLDWLAALLGADSLPGLMLIAGEGETTVILANEKAARAARNGKVNL